MRRDTEKNFNLGNYLGLELINRKSPAPYILYAIGIQLFGRPSLNEFGHQVNHTVKTLQATEAMCSMRHHYVQTIRQRAGDPLAIGRWRHRVPLTG